MATTEAVSEKTLVLQSPFEQRAQVLLNEQIVRRAARQVERERLDKVAETHLAKLKAEKDAAIDELKNGQTVEIRNSAIDRYNEVISHIGSYKQSVEKRGKPKFYVRHAWLPDGIVQRKEFGRFEGDKNNRWQRYGSQERIPIDRLTLQNISGSWASAFDFDYPGGAFGDRSTPLHWLPRREELLRIKTLAEKVHEGIGLPSIIDIGCGTGLLSYLMAAEGGLSVVGMDPDEALLLDDYEFETRDEEGNYVGIQTKPYEHPNLKLIAGTNRTMLEAFQDTPPDLVVSSWMPEDMNLLPDICNLQAKAIVLIHPTYETRFDDLLKSYKKAYRWSGPGNDQVTNFSQVACSSYFIPNELENGNVIELFLRDGIYSTLLKSIDVPKETKYSWENDNPEEIIPWWGYFQENPKYSERIPILRDRLQKLMAVEPMEELDF